MKKCRLDFALILTGWLAAEMTTSGRVLVSPCDRALNLSPLGPGGAVAVASHAGRAGGRNYTDGRGCAYKITV